ncbi:hypothetical protein B0E53_04607 [Micromonospora sp. MH33]|nr:hypothetical protein B0E53_04607 [Micromonospora sp. MH33]
MLPTRLRCTMTGRFRRPSASVYDRSNRSGLSKSSWMVEMVDSRPAASTIWMSIFGP